MMGDLLGASLALLLPIDPGHPRHMRAPSASSWTLRSWARLLRPIAMRPKHRFFSQPRLRSAMQPWLRMTKWRMDMPDRRLAGHAGETPSPEALADLRHHLRERFFTTPCRLLRFAGSRMGHGTNPVPDTAGRSRHLRRTGLFSARCDVLGHRDVGGTMHMILVRKTRVLPRLIARRHVGKLAETGCDDDSAKWCQGILLTGAVSASYRLS